MTNATSSPTGASTRASRSRASIRRWRSWSCPNRSVLYRLYRRPSARGVADGSRSRPCGRHHALLHWSTRAQSLSDARLFHPCSQSRAAWLDPLTRIRDLPWPRFASSRGSNPVSRSAVAVCENGRPRAQPVQPRCHDFCRSFAEVIEWLQLTAVNQNGNLWDSLAASWQRSAPMSTRFPHARHESGGACRSWENACSAVNRGERGEPPARAYQRATSVGNLWHRGRVRRRGRRP